MAAIGFLKVDLIFAHVQLMHTQIHNKLITSLAVRRRFIDGVATACTVENTFYFFAVNAIICQRMIYMLIIRRWRPHLITVQQQAPCRVIDTAVGVKSHVGREEDNDRILCTKLNALACNDTHNTLYLTSEM